jgi:hypothetical protein
VTEPAPEGDRPTSNDSAAATQADGQSLSRAADNLPSYVVLLVTRYGAPRRCVYLDLGAARTAVARARGKGLHAELVLAKLEPVQADPELHGGDQQ